MKWFALMAFVLALIATVYCSDENACAAQEFTDDEIAEMFLCLANGADFNGKKTCQVGCRVACQQPGCGGYHSCTQIPNPGETSTYLHKYKCRCNKS